MLGAMVGVTALGVLALDDPPTLSSAASSSDGSTNTSDGAGSAPSTTSTTTTISPVAMAASDPSLAPVCGPVAGALPGSAGCRIIAFYGNPLSKRMGILGQNPKPEMLAGLASWTKTWQTADPKTPTRCALELIAITAQASPGEKKLHRARLTEAKIDEVLGWAREGGCLLILDVQVGWSSVPDEMPFLERWLNEPDVHLGLDPEWDMDPGVVPGTKIGRMSAADIQFAIDFVANIVKAKNLTPKLIIVHRFRDFMVQNPELLRPVPEIRLLANADGFGPPPTKLVTFDIARANMPTQLAGFKLFFKNDKPMLQPNDVLPLIPAPVFINYQ